MELKISKKLPLWATVGTAYRLAWNNIGYYWKISRSWLMVSLPVLSFYQWLVLPTTKKFSCALSVYEQGKDMSVPSLMKAPYLLFTVPVISFSLIVAASIAVAWHRLILLNEKTATTLYFRLDKVVLNYFIFGSFLALLSIFPSIFVFLPGQVVIIAVIAGLVFHIITLLIIVRMSVMLPVKALALTRITAKDVWQKTRSNFWRLFVGTFLCVLPTYVLAHILVTKSVQLLMCQNDLANVALNVLSTVLNMFVMLPISLAFLSLSYKYFFQDAKTVE